MKSLPTHLAALLVALLAVTLVSTGCNDAAGPDDDKGAHHDDHGHDHDDHGHTHKHPPHGPNGGHIFELNSAEYNCEWCKFKDNDVIKMHLVDKANKKNVAAMVDSFVVKPMAGNDDLTFTLEAENADDAGNASTYMLDDADLSTAIPLGVSIEIKMGDKMLTGKIEAHEPLDH